MASLPLKPGMLVPHHAFTKSPDYFYLQSVIRLLKGERESRGLTHHGLSRRARIKMDVILAAEEHGVIPSSRELKAWCFALKLCWESLWSRAMETPKL